MFSLSSEVLMKPFHGITFCPTAIQDEDASRSLSKKIIKLGGIFSKDLTKTVNVLIVGQTTNTNKYKFAVKYRYDLVFTDLKMIDQLYQLWLSGDDITMKSHSHFNHIDDINIKKRMLLVFRKKYSANPLLNFHIFIGRVSNKDVKISKLEKICNILGVSNCNSTHFVKDCKSTANSPVLFVTDNLVGARVDAARQQNLPVVHYKWLLDCLKRNAMLEYDPYYLLENILKETPFDDIGKKACECWNQLTVDFNDVENDIDTVPSDLNVKINNNISTVLNKFKPQGDKIWQRVMKLESISSNNSIEKQIAVKKQDDISNNITPMIFENCKFIIHEIFSHKHSKILEKVIKSNSGIIQDGNKELAFTHFFTIIPSNIPLDQFKLTEEMKNTTIVTEFFVERCLHYKQLLLPLDSWSKPFFKTKNFNIEPSLELLHNDGEDLNVSITGFYGVALLHLMKIFEILKPMGINYTKYLNKTTDILLINLSSLPSIPKDHPLWNNEFSDLFDDKNDLDMNTNDNQVFRNSMKRKIEFIKEEHSIPVVTPVFILNIFSQTSLFNQNMTPDIIHLNNINWCIICPRGKKDDFTCKIVPKIETNKIDVDSLFHHSNEIEVPSIKYSRKEFLEKVNNSSLSLPNTKKNHFLKKPALQEKNPKHPLLEQQRDDMSMKRTRVESGTTLEPVKRTSSWGKMMSEEVSNTTNNLLISESVFENENNKHLENSLGSTQVTYGKSNQANLNSKPVRKLTRQHMREMDI